MLNRLGSTFLLLLTLGIPAVASDSKMLPACAATLQCEIDPEGRARCALGEFQSAQCIGRLAATVMSWSQVTASTDGMVTREVIHAERREWPSLKSHGTAAAQAIAAEPFDFVLRSGEDIEVHVTLLDASGALLWSSRLFLLSEEAGFRTSLNHPAMEDAGTTHHVAFEKNEP